MSVEDYLKTLQTADMNDAEMLGKIFHDFRHSLALILQWGYMMQDDLPVLKEQVTDPEVLDIFESGTETIVKAAETLQHRFNASQEYYRQQIDNQ